MPQIFTWADLSIHTGITGIHCTFLKSARQQTTGNPRKNLLNIACLNGLECGTEYEINYGEFRPCKLRRVTC